MRRRLLLLAMVSMLGPIGCMAQQRLPMRPLPEGVGVNIHFRGGHGAELDQIAAAGIRVVRMDFTWARIEHKKEVYGFSDYDRLTAELTERGIRPYYILDYSNLIYEQRSTTQRDGRDYTAVNAPQHPASIAAFARFAAAAAEHYKGQPIIWEVWNEPNIFFWHPEPSARQWIALTAATCRAMRLADPDCTIVGPATSEFPWPYLEEVCKSGLLDELDALSVHPYRHHRDPETAAADYAKLRKLIATYATGDKQFMPILSGEWGYSTAANPAGVSPEKQACYAVRQQLINRLSGVPVSIWYDFKDDGADPKDIEHHFGLVTRGGKPKPSYLALQNMTAQLAGYRINRRLKTAREDDYVLLLRHRGQRFKIVAWTTAKPHAITLTPSGFTTPPISAVDLYGHPAPAAATITTARLKLQLTEAPIYVTPGENHRR